MPTLAVFQLYRGSFY